MSSTPVSEASTTQPSVVSSQRPGRRPFRSSVAPITRAVGERDRCRAVPGLGQALVEAVEAAERPRTRRGAAVRLRHHHHQRVRQRPAREHEQLEHVVEHRGVGAAGTDHRQHLREVVAEELGRELRLARANPVHVAAQRVDLAVVRNQPVRVRELPARERVRREARVHERERAREPLVDEVGEVAARAAAPTAFPCRRASAPRSSGSRGRRRRRARRPAGSRRASARGRAVLDVVRRADEELADDRREELRLPRRLPAARRARRASRARSAPRLRRSPRAAARARRAAPAELRQEADADAVPAERRQLEVDDVAQERVGKLHAGSRRRRRCPRLRRPRRGAPGSRAR